MRGNKLLRLIDYYFGIIFLRVYGALYKKRKKPKLIKKIALFKSAAIGDLVLITGILNDLRNISDYEITLILGQDNSKILPLINNNFNSISLKISKPIQAIKMIRRNEYDCFIDLGAWPRIDSIITTLSKSKFTVGFKTNNQFRHYAYDCYIPHNDNIHEVENYKNILKYIINVSFVSPPSLIPIQQVKISISKFIFIHMWPGGYKSYKKEWGEENWVRLIILLLNAGYKVVLSGTKENKISNQIIVDRFKNGEVLDISGNYNLVELSDIICQSIAVVSVNTGIAHIASALNKPIVCLNGPTSPVRWGPLGENVCNVNSTHDGAGFLNLGFEYERGPSDTMNYIQVEDVYNNLMSLIK